MARVKGAHFDDGPRVLGDGGIRRITDCLNVQFFKLGMSCGPNFADGMVFTLLTFSLKPDR
jgi:hypothetical protein